MIRLLYLVTIYAWRAFLQWLAWRAFLVTMVVNQIVTPLLSLAVWSVALPGSATISTYYVALLAVQLMTVSYENHTFSDNIYSGALIHMVLKPRPVLIEPLGANVAMRIWHLLIGLPIIILAGILVHVSFESRAILLSLPALLLAATLRFLFTYLLALSALWTQQAHGVVNFGEILIFLLGGSAVPIELFPRFIRPLGEVFPFRMMLGFPAEIASSSLSEKQVFIGYGVQFLWVLVFMSIVFFVWNAGMRQYTAAEG